MAREGVAEAWSRSSRDKAGDVAVGGARSAYEYKSALGVDAIARGNLEALRSVAAAPSPAMAPAEARAAGERVNQYVQQQRFVKGRTFFQNGNQWTDSNVQKMQTARRVQVRFNSEAYFDLLAKNQEALPWFSLGPNVDVALGDTIYEVRE